MGKYSCFYSDSGTIRYRYEKVNLNLYLNNQEAKEMYTVDVARSLMFLTPPRIAHKDRNHK